MLPKLNSQAPEPSLWKPWYGMENQPAASHSSTPKQLTSRRLGSIPSRSFILPYYLECPDPKLKQVLSAWLRLSRADHPQHTWPFMVKRNPPPYRFALISPDGQRFAYLPVSDWSPDLELKASPMNGRVTFPSVIRLNSSMTRQELWKILQPVSRFVTDVLEEISNTSQPESNLAATVPQPIPCVPEEALQAVIESYRSAGDFQDDGRFTISADYRKRFLAMKCSVSPNSTILGCWKEILLPFKDSATIELRGGVFAPTILAFRMPQAIETCSHPPEGELLDLLFKPHHQADQTLLALAALIKAFFEKGVAQVTWRCSQRETTYFADGRFTSRPSGRNEPELIIPGLSWKDAHDLHGQLYLVYPSSSCPWDNSEPAIYLKGGAGFDHCPWPAPPSLRVVDLDRPFSLLIYLHNKTGNFPNGSIRFVWPGGQYKIAASDWLPADIVVFNSRPLQRDPSLARLSNSNLVDDVKALARPHIRHLLNQLKDRPLEERVHYFSASLGLKELPVHRYPLYRREILQVPVFRTISGKELSIYELCVALQNQGFLGEVQNIETVCPRIPEDTLFRKSELPNLFSQQIENVLSRVDGTWSPLQTLQDLISSL